MDQDYRRSFEDPDEVVEVGGVRSEIVRLGGVSVGRDVHAPGWRWSEHVRPLVGTEWCESRHVGYVLGGQLHVRMMDGTEFDLRAGDLFDIRPGHDGWVVGEEPFEDIAWMGATTWLAPLQTLKERVLLTLMFTDIVDSTVHAEGMGDRRWLDLLAGHNQRIRETVGRFGGRVTKDTGDGVLAAFDGAARAVRCAVSCHVETRDLGLAIRTAVHTGEVDVDGDQVSGVVIHEAARILSHAGSGEVVVSELTRTFARDPGLAFEDRGVVELRGVPEPVRLHAVVVE